MQTPSHLPLVANEGQCGGASALAGGVAGKWAVKGLKTFSINGIASPLLKSSLTGLVTGAAGGYGGGFAAGFIMSGGNLAEAHKAGMNSLVMGAALGMASGAYTGYKQAKALDIDLWTGKPVVNENSSSKVMDAANVVKDWLGENYKSIENKSGDNIFMSEDGTRKIRFDITNSHGDQPHFHLEIFKNGKWRDALDTHRFYPKP